MSNVMQDTHIDDLENQLAQLLGDLSRVQDDLLNVLAEKRQRIASNDLQGLGELNDRATELCQELELCQSRRQTILAAAAEHGTPAESLERLATTLLAEHRDDLGKQAKEIGSRMRLLQHQCLTNWVVAQRTLLHVSQMLEIIASGGRLQPTYGTGAAALSRGSLMDGEA